MDKFSLKDLMRDIDPNKEIAQLGMDGVKTSPGKKTSAPSMNGLSLVDGANAALGLTSLVTAAKNKKPKNKKPNSVSLSIRPAQGDEDGLQSKLNSVDQQVASTTRDINQVAGSDLSTNMSARLGVQANATKARNDAFTENSKMIREDEGRVEALKNQETLINAELQEQFRREQFGTKRQDYLRTQDATRAGMSSSLQYEANRQADIRNKEAAEGQANEFIDAIDRSEENDFYLKLVREGKGHDEINEIIQSRRSLYPSRKTKNYVK